MWKFGGNYSRQFGLQALHIKLDAYFPYPLVFSNQQSTWYIQLVMGWYAGANSIVRHVEKPIFWSLFSLGLQHSQKYSRDKHFAVTLHFYMTLIITGSKVFGWSQEQKEFGRALSNCQMQDLGNLSGHNMWPFDKTNLSSKNTIVRVLDASLGEIEISSKLQEPSFTCLAVVWNSYTLPFHHGKCLLLVQYMPFSWINILQVTVVQGTIALWLQLWFTCC